MGHRLHVMVPVAIVEIRHQSACGLGQIVRVLLNRAMIREALDQYDLLTIGRETESLNTDFRVGQLHATRSIGVHFPQLSLTEEGNLRAILYPSGTALAHRICGEACGLHDGFTRLSRLYEEHGVALVLLYTVVSDLISHLFPIGRGCCCPQSSHGPKRLRRHQV